MSILKVSGLKKYYKKGGSLIRAVDGVDLSIQKGESLGLVGESGCGKSTLARTVVRLEEPTEGRVCFKDIDILSLSENEMRLLRRRMQIVFQEPFSSLSPRMKVLDNVGRPLEIFGLCHGESDKIEKVANALKLVNLPQDSLRKYPHELSGGQQQRIAIARALICNPEFVVLDEPTSALDVSEQAKILNLLADLREKLHLSYLFISHDLSVVKFICDHVVVMYLGEIVEQAPAKEFFSCTLHPYTRTLLSALLIPDLHLKGKVPVRGEATSSDAIKGCKFYNRCAFRKNICKDSHPALVNIKKKHSVSCHLF